MFFKQRRDNAWPRKMALIIVGLNINTIDVFDKFSFIFLLTHSFSVTDVLK